MSKDALVRLEYKIDCVIQALKEKGLMLPELPGLVGIESDCCSVCNQPIKIQSDFESETPAYTCGCTLPVTIVPGISRLLPQRTTNEHPSRNQADQVSSDQPPSGDRDR
jgi:hypothetical protein